jgi:predicted O-linked N-acetylglucosamine transferase (SPINDLY family)
MNFSKPFDNSILTFLNKTPQPQVEEDSNYHWYKLYQDTLNNNLNYKNEELLCAEGIKLMKHVKEIETKQDIFNKLVELYPKRPDLYYYIGFELREIDLQSAVNYFEKSYNLCNSNLENVIELCNCLLGTHQKNKIYSLMKKNKNFDKFVEDYRFNFLYIESLDKNSFYQKSFYLKKNISILLKKNLEPLKQKYHIIRCRCDLINTYEILGQFDNAAKLNEQNLLEYEPLNILQTPREYTLEEKEIYTNVLSRYAYSSNFVYDPIPNEIYYAYDAYMKKNPIKLTHKQNRKPRIGYISSDFINHAVSMFILPILKNHNTEDFDIYLFTNSIHTDHELFIEFDYTYFLINKMEPLEIANLIKKHNIDILIDLNGQTTGNSLEVLTYKPAPVQMTYIGYLNTTGLSCIDYKITDSVCDNVNTTQYYSEKLLRMPRSCYLFKNYYQKEKIKPKITETQIILGSLNREEKINKHVLNTWKTIMKNCPNTTIMILLNAKYDIEKRLDFYMKHLNVSKERLILIPVVFYNEQHLYYELLSKIDILLDAFPHSSMTTSCNALNNSIPVVTYLKPNIHLHNTTASILLECGLPELVTYSEEEYISKVEELVNNPKQIDTYKETIHDAFIKAMDPEPFMKEYEAMLTKVYEEDVLHGSSLISVPSKIVP